MPFVMSMLALVRGISVALTLSVYLPLPFALTLGPVWVSFALEAVVIHYICTKTERFIASACL